MKRMMIQADEALLRRARSVAADRGVSVAQVVRDALERELGAAGAQPEIRSVGAFRSVDGDLSLRASDDEFVPPPFVRSRHGAAGRSARRGRRRS
jgi:hypothetical protein